MKTIEHTIEIEASTAATWGVLADFAAYDDWNPFMTVAGPISEPGDRPEVQIRVGRRTMRFRPTVSTVEAGRAVAWRGRFLLSGVFDGTHEFLVEDLGDGRSRFTQRETFSGVLVPFMRSVLRDTSIGCAAMDTALAARAERRATPTASG